MKTQKFEIYARDSRKVKLLWVYDEQVQNVAVVKSGKVLPRVSRHVFGTTDTLRFNSLLNRLYMEQVNLIEAAKKGADGFKKYFATLRQSRDRRKQLLVQSVLERVPAIVGGLQ